MAVFYDKINLTVNFLFFYCLITGNMDSARNREIRQVITSKCTFMLTLSSQK